MRKGLIVILATLGMTILAINSMAQPINPEVKYFQLKYIGYDEFNNGYRLSVNISINSPGHMIYVEEYYSIDGNNNPMFVNSRRFYNDELIPSEDDKLFNATFEILRPPTYTSGGYRLIKSIILLDDKRILERWLTKNVSFIDNTASPEDDTALSDIQNVDKYETREKNIIIDLPVSFVYSTLDTISEVNVTGSKNADLSLKVELLKGRSSSTYKPDGIIYKYFNIIADNQNIKEYSIKYRIERSWIKDNKIDKLGLLTWDSNNKRWIGSATKYIANDSTYIYFESISKDLSQPESSQFVIVGIPIQNNLSKTNNISKTNNTKNETLNNTKNETLNNKNSSAKAIIGQTNQTKEVNTREKEPLVKPIPGFESFLAIVILILLSKRRK